MGTTSEKLTYLNTTKNLIKEELNLGGANITNEPFRAYKGKLEGIYKDFLANGTDTLWNNWEKVSGSGTTLSLNNTIEAKMDFVYKGNTYQYTTTGKNKFAYGTTAIDKTATYRPNQHQRLLLTATANPNEVKFNYNGNYCMGYIEMNGIDGTLPYKISFSIKENTTDYTPSCAIDTEKSSNQKLVFIVYGNNRGTAVSSSNYFILTNIQVESGSTATSYEPYTNGASPNPDYPQDIQVVTGDNTIKVEGKNLLDTKVFENRIINCYVVNSNGTITQTATDTNFWQSSYLPNSIILNSGTYTISVNNRNGSKLQVYNLTTNSNIVEASVDSYTFTLNNDNQVINAKLYGASSYPFTFTMQIEKGSTATTYEPYQSQSYPISLGDIELCKIGDYQDKIAKSTGKNLFDVSTITENTYIDENGNTGTSSVTNLSDYIEVKSNTSYTLSYDYSTLLNSNQRNVCYYNENKTFISSDVYIPTDKTHAITTPNNAKYIRISYDKNCYSIMLNEGSTALPYEPYGKVWYLNKQIGKVVLNGSESWSTTDSGMATQMFATNIGRTMGERSTIPIYSNMYKYVFWDYGPWVVNNSISYYSTDKIRIKDNAKANVDDFKTWLSTHNTTVYYVLATPTTTEISDTTLISQLEAIKKSYNTQTNISQTNNDMPFELDVVALGELEI